MTVAKVVPGTGEWKVQVRDARTGRWALAAVVYSETLAHAFAQLLTTMYPEGVR